MDLLPFLLNFKGTAPLLNSTTITTLTDRLRLEMHSFHLALGEMTITLEDIEMIYGLPIQGRALIGKVNSKGWRQRVAGLVGVEPPLWIHETKKDPRPSGVFFLWLQEHFL
uniref:Aminotransferase-like plant mobile domain-containing protein n=1 Tax=Hordeum vulgare subsp. vulgare TaxID=112509 RepID=A0A8I6WXN4_HORVV